jgi:hypothetical protein
MRFIMLRRYAHSDGRVFEPLESYDESEFPPEILEDLMRLSCVVRDRRYNEAKPAAPVVKVEEVPAAPVKRPRGRPRKYQTRELVATRA